MHTKNLFPLPIPARRALRKLGENIRDARRRRRIPTALMAERAGISRTTLYQIERGYPGVSCGNYAAVIFCLGMVDRLAQLVDPGLDHVGLALESDMLPKRIRIPSRKSSQKPGKNYG